MKIITNDAVYVQKNDMGFLNQTDLPIPASIYMKVFGNGITIIDNSNRFEFVKYEEKSEIEYFRNLDWIVDYDSVKDLSENQIIELEQGIFQKRNSIAQKFDSMSEEDRRANRHMVRECEILDFKRYSLGDLLLFKQGHLEMILPEGVDYPEGYKKDSSNVMKKLLSKFKKSN